MARASCVRGFIGESAKFGRKSCRQQSRKVQTENLQIAVSQSTDGRSCIPKCYEVQTEVRQTTCTIYSVFIVSHLCVSLLNYYGSKLQLVFISDAEVNKT